MAYAPRLVQNLTGFTGLVRCLLVQVVDPANELRHLDGLDVEIDDESLLAVAREHAVQLEIGTRIDFLVRYPGRDVDEVTRRRLGDELEVLSPTQPRDSVHDVDDAIGIAVVMRDGSGLRIDRHGPGPELRCTRPLGRHRRTPVHAGRLCGIAVELIRSNDPHTVRPPAARGHAGSIRPEPGISQDYRDDNWSESS